MTIELCDILADLGRHCPFSVLTEEDFVIIFLEGDGFLQPIWTTKGWKGFVYEQVFLSSVFFKM